MTRLDLGRRPKKFGLALPLVLIAAVAALGIGGYFLLPKFEWRAPEVKITPETEVLGLNPLEIEVADRGTGLESLKVSLMSAGAEYPLADERYETRVATKKLTVGLSANLTGLKEGPAVLEVRARDGSLWRFFGGNEAVVRKNMTIDVSPPSLELIADDPYINFGGSGLVVYRPSPDAVRSGVRIGRHFFPGYKAHPRDPNAYLVFFAHPYDVPETEKAALVAVDKAGNERRIGLAYTLKDVRYKKSTISLSDEFIQNKVVPLVSDVAARQASAKDIFIQVNRSLRKQNEDTIKALGEKTRPQMLWSGAFGQLSNSKVEANFADARTYLYRDEQIDTAYHLGFDLSVTKRYPVEAANSGVVLFVGDLGIYGNTVLIDHGLGLTTLYSHLSSIDVKVGDSVAPQQVIGKTGETGLAAGDHLHFAVYLHGV
ncbi:MAG TPA: M23 family metallopeptidase, partial [Candidatus Eisenbacteria bacterium]|nr:M23 family metallopeptidase [Candidatus Eisenbacteria bacterium]